MVNLAKRTVDFSGQDVAAVLARVFASSFLPRGLRGQHAFFGGGKGVFAEGLFDDVVVEHGQLFCIRLRLIRLLYMLLQPNLLVLRMRRLKEKYLTVFIHLRRDLPFFIFVLTLFVCRLLLFA